MIVENYMTDWGAVRISPDDARFFATVDSWIGPHSDMPKFLRDKLELKRADIERVALWKHEKRFANA